MQGVTLASLHAAKGLEWDAVFLVGLVDGTLPITHALKGGEPHIEEERRLFYVGVTVPGNTLCARGQKLGRKEAVQRASEADF